MKRLHCITATAMLCLLAAVSAKAAGWPANYQGVMLQAFYWDSYSDTKWTNLESQAEELSEYFSLIWVPNSAKAASSPGMGYDPVYWFTNHNTSFGTEKQLRSMIATYKELGVGIIADVVINHRSGKSNWLDFPAETWNGTTYQIGTTGICSTDEVWSQAAYSSITARGAADTGEDFDGSRDLDHTNATVQANCKAYCKFLLDDMGYAGFRLDMVKGYAGQYTKIYNQYANPTYCVGECFDGSYDVVAAWIEAAGRTSAAFDFPLKYQLNSAFSSGNMTDLVWYANGVTPQPAGMIHYGYPQLAVTFIDNHDTYRESWNKFNGNVPAANAFIICSPGTPCVFLPHWKEYKDEIKKLIEARNLVGVHSQSAVTVLQTSSNCYMAEVTGTRGKLVIKVGSAMVSPEGYTDDQIWCYGNDYCVWTTVKAPSYPSSLHLMGHVAGYAWATSKGISATGSSGKYTYSDVTVDDSGDGYGYISFATTLGATWDAVNASDRYGSSTKDEAVTLGSPSAVVQYTGGGTASGCNSWKLPAGRYDITVDLSKMQMTVKTHVGIDLLDTDEADQAPVYFDLQGRPVANPAPGAIYIRLQGGRATKVRL